MNDRLTDDEIDFYRERLSDIRQEFAYVVTVEPDRMERMLDELERYRETLDQIRDITDPDTDTAQPPMAAIRDVLEDIDG